MEPTPALVAQLRHDKIDAARRMSPEQKLLAGAELFAFACETAMAGIRMQYPGIDDKQAQQHLRKRLMLLQRQE